MVTLSTSPNYTLRDASLLTRLPSSTLSYWKRGRQGVASPLIQAGTHLSFINLVELHMVGMFRGQHGVSLQRVRLAVAQLRRRYPDDAHPLATKQFWTDGRHILERDVEGGFVGLSESGQMSFREVVECYARRVEWDGDMPARFYPWTVNVLTTARIGDVRKTIVVDPAIAFGRAVVDSTRVTTRAIKDLWDVGLSVKEIADEFDLASEQVEDAVRIEEEPRSRRVA